jgi:2-oxoglutarate dehydrogenase E2 component (dihydrolipoamide succinyltransferase)
MNHPVIIPAVGESISSGVIALWHKKDNDPVAVGDLLFTLETDKVSTEVTAHEAGILKTLVAEGAEVKIGATVAEIIPGATPAAEPSTVIPPVSAAALIAPEKRETPATEKIVSPAPDKITTSPSSTPAPAETRVTRKKLTPLRRKIALQLVAAQQNAAILTTFNESDLTSLIKLRRDVQETFQAKHGVKLGLMSFFIKAAVEALQAFPEVNVQLEGEELLQNHYYDIGVAVGTEKGLVVPVVRDAEKRSLAELEQQLLEYANKARAGKIELTDLQGGVFTISNGGVYGSLLSTPILNPPQSAILGMHTIQERPIVIDGKIEIRAMMYLALSYDHRVIDGAQAVGFLKKIKESIEHPLPLFVA